MTTPTPETVAPDVSLLPRLPFTKAIRTVIGDATGKPVGRGRVPTVGEGAGRVQAAPPFLIVYPLHTSELTGPTYGQQAHADATWHYQFTLVSTDADQIEWLRDKLLSTFLSKRPGGAWSTPIDVPGMVCTDRGLADENSVTGTDRGAGSMSSDVRLWFAVTPIRAT